MIPIDKLKQMVRMIIETHDDEIGCMECYAELDRFVDLVLNGKQAEEALPLVQQHLNVCGDCKEEFQALLEALQATGE